ncbi:MAG TPA: MFS transporter, partial [Ktedonobacteraceae bacterium]|nr:MFS transporter [Ktedonobacteraceae bacterium]
MKNQPTRANEETLCPATSAVTQRSGLQVRSSSIWANVVSSLLLRVASRTSFVLLGFYLGERFASTTLVVLVIEAFYLTELTLAPISGSLSDRWGRKPFLLLAPFLGALAALFLLGGSLLSHPTHHVAFNPRLALFLLLILCGRLLEGATTAFNTPACLGYITDTTAHAPYMRARVMTAFEVVTVGGIALAIPFGGQVSTWLGIWGFLVVVGLHALNMLIVAFVVQEHEQRVTRTAHRTSLLESFKMLREKRVFTFLPAWLSISSLVGSWTTLA